VKVLPLKLEITGIHFPKTKAQALRLLGLEYADINKKINAKKGKIRFQEATEDNPQTAYLTKIANWHFKNEIYNFTLRATKEIRLDNIAELPLTILSGSQPKENRSIQGEEFFTTQEAASMLKVNSITIRKLIKKGELEAAKVGGLWRVTGTGIKNLLKSQQEGE